MGRLIRLGFLILCPTITIAVESGDDMDSYPNDPYLAYQPEFARSLPIQILITGIILTLACILLLNLFFTFQSHWPVARLNYALQVTSALVMLLSLILSFNVILTTAADRSREWPYMLDYVAIPIPPTSWKPVPTACWYVLEAVVSGLVHITHIQFVTLLYPSNLEAKLIILLLGPLTFLSSITELFPIWPSPSQHLTDISDSVRNISNSTLSLLFTIALCIWGFVVNRKQAWRNDGGTGTFGGAALLLATTSTVLNFLSVSNKGPYLWLPGLLRAVVLWQSFLGWWWWVGAGMTAGRELEETLERLELERQRQVKKAGREKSHTKQGQGRPDSAVDRRRLLGLLRRSRSHPKQDDDLNNVQTSKQRSNGNTSSEDDDDHRNDDSSVVTETVGIPIESDTIDKHPSHASFFRSCWNTVRRAHLHAVKLQTLEWFVLRRDRSLKHWTSNIAPATGDMELEEFRREMMKRTDIPRGTGVSWWRPVGNWRRTDRTVY